MPVKVVGTKPDDQVQAKLSREHPLLKATPAEINTYIDESVTDLESAKRVLKILAKAIALNSQGKR